MLITIVFDTTVETCSWTMAGLSEVLPPVLATGVTTWYEGVLAVLATGVAGWYEEVLTVLAWCGWIAYICEEC